MSKWILFCFAILTSFCAHAASVRLINDSPYQLRAVVRAADGTLLGEMVINSRQTSTWSDAYGKPGYINQPTYSQTPYSILWYCMNGDDYSFCDDISTGSTVTAQSCSGGRLCKPPPKKQTPGRESILPQQEPPSQ